MSESESSPRPVRLVVPAATSAAVDAAIVEIAYLARTKVNKAQVTDALLRVALRHLDEVAAELRQGASNA